MPICTRIQASTRTVPPHTLPPTSILAAGRPAPVPVRHHVGADARMVHADGVGQLRTRVSHIKVFSLVWYALISASCLLRCLYQHTYLMCDGSLIY
jgi:hypothetical protein